MDKINSIFRNGKVWLKSNWPIILILVIGAFLRLYKIGEYMTFLGDEGRDVIIIRRLLVYFDPILIGPGTSIGNMYLGPLYYYLMAPALFLANFSPVGPSVMVALFGIATTVLIYLMARQWFGRTAAVVASFFYAISPTVIVYSRSSWNPNVMPFFALLSVYSIWRVWKFKEFKWLVILGVSYAFVLQSHYLGLLLAPVLFIFWILSRVPVRYSLFAILLFMFLMSPLVIFDARHGWNNTNAMKTFFAARQTTVSAKPWNALPKIYPIFEKVNVRLLAGRDKNVGRILTAILLLGTIILVIKNKKNIFQTPLFLLLIWLLFALIGLGLYKQEIYDHYYGFFFPAPFLLLGAIAEHTVHGIKYKVILYCALAILVLVNFQNSPLKYPPAQQLGRSEEVAKKISEEFGGQQFNLAVVAERNYEDGYQYFLEKDHLPVVDIDAQRPETITNQLFVVCEMPKDKCDPTHSAKAEVANFGWSKISDQWTVYGVQLYKLLHTQ